MLKKIAITGNQGTKGQIRIIKIPVAKEAIIPKNPTNIKIVLSKVPINLETKLSIDA